MVFLREASLIISTQSEGKNPTSNPRFPLIHKDSLEGISITDTRSPTCLFDVVSQEIIFQDDVDDR
jgi:hypothetical protein